MELTHSMHVTARAISLMIRLEVIALCVLDRSNFLKVPVVVPNKVPVVVPNYTKVTHGIQLADNDASKPIRTEAISKPSCSQPQAKPHPE